MAVSLIGVMHCGKTRTQFLEQIQQKWKKLVMIVETVLSVTI